MLSQITLSNFFSLKDEIIIDLRAANSRIFNKPETQSNTFSENGSLLLKSIAVFGANASGKSNLLRAIEVCLRYIRDSHNYTESTPAQFEVFKFNDHPLPSSFEMEFDIDGEKYEYGFSVLAGKIVEEHLYSYPKKYKALVFKREADGDGKVSYSFSKKFSRPKEVVANTSDYALFLTVAALMNRSEAVRILNFVTNKFVIDLPKFGEGTFERLLENNKETVINALNYADSDIVDYELKDSEGIGKGKRIVTYHKNQPSVPFDFDREESGGTRRLLRLLVAFMDVANNGKVLIIDELETSLHPQLVKYAVRIFNQSEKAQLIFSTHDLDLLDVRVLRPDQIYFASKDYSDGSTEVYSLADFSDYKGYKNLRRDYDQGRFDAIPVLPTL